MKKSIVLICSFLIIIPNLVAVENQLKHISDQRFKDIMKSEVFSLKENKFDRRGNLKSQEHVLEDVDSLHDLSKPTTTWKIEHNQRNYDFIGFDHGEFGGKFEITNNDSEGIFFLDKSVISVYKFKGGELLISGGLSHLGTFEGFIYSLDWSADAIKSRKLLESIDATPLFIGAGLSKKNGEVALFLLIGKEGHNWILGVNKDGGIEMDCRDMVLTPEEVDFLIP